MAKAAPPLIETALRSDELNKCVTCGLCQAVCPTFLYSGSEGLTARGKIVMMRAMLDGALALSPSLAALFDDCLTCYACQSVCPSGVQTERLWTAARQDLADCYSTSQLKRWGLKWTIGKPWVFRLLVRLGGLFGFAPDDPQGVDLDALLPLPFRGAPALRKLREEYPPVGESRGSVGMLLGCSVNLYEPHVAEGAIKLLTAAGYRVLIPKNQVCCGAPAINNSAWTTARKLALRTARLFNGLNVEVVTSCDATCAGAMINDYRELFLGEKIELAEVERLAAKTRQLGQVLQTAVDSGWLRFDTCDAKVTVHDSCHSTHYRQGKVNWRKVIQRVPGVVIVEMADAGHCCGFGGSYSFTHRRDSMAISEVKLRHAIATGAQEILVGSPGCALRLLSTQREVQANAIKIRHAVNFLADRLANSIIY